MTCRGRGPSLAIDEGITPRTKLGGHQVAKKKAAKKKVAKKAAKKTAKKTAKKKK